MASASTAAAVLAGGRALIGAALVAAPAPITRVWTGDDRPAALVPALDPISRPTAEAGRAPAT
jgi:hypothetical protein